MASTYGTNGDIPLQLVHDANQSALKHLLQATTTTNGKCSIPTDENTSIKGECSAPTGKYTSKNGKDFSLTGKGTSPFDKATSSSLEGTPLQSKSSAIQSDNELVSSVAANNQASISNIDMSDPSYATMNQEIARDFARLPTITDNAGVPNSIPSNNRDININVTNESSNDNNSRFQYPQTSSMRAAEFVPTEHRTPMPVDRRPFDDSDPSFEDISIIFEEDAGQQFAYNSLTTSPTLHQRRPHGFQESIISTRSLRGDGTIKTLTGETSTMINMIKGNVGTGMLAMPQAFMYAGLYLGLVALPLLGVVCIYCMHLLLKSSHALCQRVQEDSLTLGATVRAAFSTGPQALRKCAPYMTVMTTVFLVLTQIGFCCVYYEFIADSLYQVIECSSYSTGFSRGVYCGIIFAPLLLVSSIRQLKNLAYISVISCCCQFASITIIFYYCMRDVFSGYHVEDSDTVNVGAMANLPLFFGTAMFTFEGIGLVLPLENKMKKPQRFGGALGVLNCGMAFVVILYTSVGYFGYRQYGSVVEGSITLNLPSHEILAVIAKYLVSLAIMLSYPLQLYVPVQVFMNMLPSTREGAKRTLATEYAIRFIIVLLTCIMAITIANLGLFISLVGAISSSYLALILPPIVHLVTFWPETGRGHIYIIRTVFILAVGLLGFVTGTYTSVLAIIESFTNPTEYTDLIC